MGSSLKRYMRAKEISFVNRKGIGKKRLKGARVGNKQNIYMNKNVISNSFKYILTNK